MNATRPTIRRSPLRLPRRTALRTVELVIVVAASVLIVLLAATAPAHAASNVLFGMEQNGGMDGAEQRTDLLDRQKDLGSQVIRYVVRWDRIARCNPGAEGTSPTAACYDFSTPDAVAAGAAARGMQVIFSVYGVPAWRNGGKGETWTGGTDAEFNAFAASYADFIQAATTRYDGRHGQTRVTRWTIWNEPNGQFWTPLRDDAGKPLGPHRYARLYDVASRRLKAVDPTLSVAVGPTAPIAGKNFPPITWTQLVAADLQQLGSPMDAWAHNAYMGTQNPFHSTMKPPYVGLGNIHDLTNLLDSFAVTRGLPVWVTEFGYQTPPSSQASVPVPKQALLLQDAMRYAWAHPRITTFIWYSVLDDDIRQNPLGFQSGLYFADGTCGTHVCPKPSAAAFRHPIWVSRVVGGKVTLWGRGGRTPAATRIFVRRVGDGWRAYANTDTATTGAVTVTLQASKGMQVMTCDTVCGPMRVVSASAAVAKAKPKRYKLKAVKLSKRASLSRGVRFAMTCAGCKITGKIVAPKGKSSGVSMAVKKEVLIGTGPSRRAGGKIVTTLKFKYGVKRSLARTTRPRVIVRAIVTKPDGTALIYDRLVTLV